MLCLPCYQGLIIESNPIQSIGFIDTCDLSNRVSASGVKKLVFYLAIVNKIVTATLSWHDSSFIVHFLIKLLSNCTLSDKIIVKLFMKKLANCNKRATCIKRLCWPPMRLK